MNNAATVLLSMHFDAFIFPLFTLFHAFSIPLLLPPSSDSNMLIQMAVTSAFTDTDQITAAG